MLSAQQLTKILNAALQKLWESDYSEVWLSFKVVS